MSWGIKEALEQINKLQDDINNTRDALAELGIKTDLVDGTWVEIQLVREEKTNETAAK